MNIQRPCAHSGSILWPDYPSQWPPRKRTPNTKNGIKYHRITGAGDTFMAAHIASEAQGMDKVVALSRALDAAATYVSGETPL